MQESAKKGKKGRRREKGLVESRQFGSLEGMAVLARRRCPARTAAYTREDKREEIERSKDRCGKRRENRGLRLRSE